MLQQDYSVRYIFQVAMQSLREGWRSLMASQNAVSARVILAELANQISQRALRWLPKKNSLPVRELAKCGPYILRQKTEIRQQLIQTMRQWMKSQS